MSSLPDKEYAVAEAALRHAKRHQAERLAAKIYTRAEKYLVRGKEEYRKQFYEQARLSFKNAARFATLAMRKAFIIRAQDDVGSSYRPPPSSPSRGEE